MEQEERVIRGVLNIDKPIGLTSMGVCRVVKGKLRAGGAPKRIKVGHGGTLDPLATGVLVVLVGKATKDQDRVMSGAKSYRAIVDLAHVSDSSDLECEPRPVEIASEPGADEVHALLQSQFTGLVAQAPPAHSAVKIGGKRSYELARKGVGVEPEPRIVRIDAIRVESYAFPELVLCVDCGKGTYIRSLARDIGRSLGTGGMLTALRRTRVGEFHSRDAVSLDQLDDALDPYSIRYPGWMSS